ncbi:MAG: coproporphyrinogen III oxidase, partial [Oscillospiraceae bacterium]|nr:coproporphyrinogen III oxidase [Oscillospiraceae bacterium]
SCYGLKLEEGTPLFERREREVMADEDTQADMYLWAVNRLKQAGLNQYEISNFAKPKYESEHNLRYWMGEEYIGFGPGAHSYFGQRRYSFVRDVDRYIRGVLHNGTVVEESEDISRGERAKEYLILRLRTTKGVDPREYHEKFYTGFDALEDKLQEYRKRGWAVYSNDNWHFTAEGFLISNSLIAELLQVQEESVMQTMRPLLERRMGLGG